jgi:hypothetical protein
MLMEIVNRSSGFQSLIDWGPSVDKIDLYVIPSA